MAILSKQISILPVNSDNRFLFGPYNSVFSSIRENIHVYLVNLQEVSYKTRNMLVYLF